MQPKRFLTLIAVFLALLAPAAAVAQPAPTPPNGTTAASTMVEIQKGDRLLSAKRTTGLLEQHGRSNDDFWAVFNHPENKGKIGMFCSHVLVDEATEVSLNERTGSRIIRGAFQCLDPTPSANIGALITLPIGRGQLVSRINELQTQLEVAKGLATTADGRATEAATRADDNRKAREDEAKANEELRKANERLESKNLFALAVIAVLFVAIGLLVWQLAKTWFARLKQALDPEFIRASFSGLMPEFAGLVSDKIRQDVDDSNRKFVAAAKEEMRDATAVAASDALVKINDTVKAEFNQLEADRRVFAAEKKGFALRETEAIGKEAWLKQATTDLAAREDKLLALKAAAEIEGFNLGKNAWQDYINAALEKDGDAAAALENAREISRDIVEQANTSRTQILLEAERIRNEAVTEVRKLLSEIDIRSIQLEADKKAIEWRANELLADTNDLAAQKIALAKQRKTLNHEFDILDLMKSDGEDDARTGHESAPLPTVQDEPYDPDAESPTGQIIIVPELEPLPGIRVGGIEVPFPGLEPGTAKKRKTMPIKSDGASFPEQTIPKPGRSPVIQEPPADEAPEIDVGGVRISQHPAAYHPPADDDPKSKKDSPPFQTNFSTKIPFIKTFENSFDTADKGRLFCGTCKQTIELTAITGHLDLRCDACPDKPWIHSLARLEEHLRSYHPECLENPPATAKSSYEILPDDFETYADPDTDVVKCKQCLEYVMLNETTGHKHAKCRLCDHVCIAAEIGKHLKEAHWSVRPPPCAPDPAPGTT